MVTKHKPLNQCPTATAWSEELQRESIAPRWLAHLDECSSCQQTLDELAGNPQLWFEAQETLADRPVDLTHITESILPLSIEPARNLLSDPLCEYELAQLQRLLPVDAEGGQPGRNNPNSYPPCEPIARIGRYDLEQLIGRGGMGLVFRAWDTQLHRVVAVKTLSMSLWSMPSSRERFIREGRAAAILNHPNIVPMYDVINDPPVPALVMQYIAGPTLEEWIQLHGPLTWSHALQIGCQLSEALCAAHAEGLVHRDIKPGNVLLEADGTRALLTDFGLVRAMDDATLTQSGLLAGTPHFMSPEQAKGEDVDGRSDLFSLGSLIYYCISGQTPFRGRESMSVLNSLCHTAHTPLCQLVPHVPIEVSRLVDRLLQKQPQHRLASSGEVRDSLRKLLAAEHRLKPKREQARLERRMLLLCVLVPVMIALWMVPRWLVWTDEKPSQYDSSPELGLMDSAVSPGANYYGSLEGSMAGMEGSMADGVPGIPGMSGGMTGGMSGQGMSMGTDSSSPSGSSSGSSSGLPAPSILRIPPPDPTELDSLSDALDLLSIEIDKYQMCAPSRVGSAGSLSDSLWQFNQELEQVQAGLRIPASVKTPSPTNAGE